MKLFRIKLDTDRPIYNKVSYQLTANNIDEALAESILRLKLNNVSFKKIESAEVFLEKSKNWLKILKLPTNNR